MDRPSGTNPFQIDGSPVAGLHFVGRESELEALVARLDEGESSAAIIGLPKVGKSSLAQVVISRLSDSGRVVHPLDAGAIATGEELFGALIDIVREATLAAPSIEPGQNANIQLGRLLKSRMRTGDKPIHVAIESLDEIEEWPDAVDALRHLRVIVSEPKTYGLVVLFVSRQTLESIEIQLLGASNLDGVVQSVHLRGFDEEELRQICSKSEAALEAVADIRSGSGGMPYNCQLLAYRAHSPASVAEIDEELNRQAERIRRFLLRAKLMETFTKCVAQPESMTLTSDLAALKSYGLVIDGAVPEWARRLAPDSEAVTRLVQQPESQTVEFKSTCRWNTRAGGMDDRIEHAVVKTVCAFLNSEGGTLAIGVDDDGAPVGLAQDFENLKNPGRDGLELFLSDLLSTKIEPNISPLVKTSFHLYSGKDVCLLTVEPSKTPTFAATVTDSKWQRGAVAFYVRNGNRTEQRLGVEMARYLLAHWGRA